jgi:hypothetical protein
MKNLKEKIELEGDFHHFTNEFNGIEICCKIVRNGFGALCGYVCINSDNTLYGKDYNDISILIDYFPHGGLTYSDFDDGSWKIGFDCSHYGDLIPQLNIESNLSTTSGEEIYRDLEFVKSECKNLAESVSKHSKLIKRLKNINNVLDQ